MNSTEDIISLAKSCGFDLAGIAKAEIPEQDRLNIKSWVEKKLFGKMEWYPRNQKLRLELDGIGFKPESVIALGLLYLDENYDSVFGKFRFKFSKYAVGTDYHTVLRQKAKPMIDSLREKFPGYHFRQGVDSFPVPEKVMAREAGIGWIGKNTNLINENIGSFFFLSVILTDLRMPHDVSSRATDRCGTCRACVDACPTGALFEEYKIDAGKCISHHTIEDRTENFPEETAESLSGWIYGCDICQDVCPWNRVKAKKNNVFTTVDEFKIRDFFIGRDEYSILNMNESDFKEFTKGSAVERISYSRFKRNIKALKKN